MKNSAPIEIIAPVSSLSNRTRLSKLAKYLLSQPNIDSIKHIAWVREQHEAQEHELPHGSINKISLINGGSYGSAFTKLLYIYWIFRVFIYCMFRSSKSPVWALGFESAFPAVLAAKIRKFDVIFDDADRFSMVFPFPRPVKRILQYLEEYTSRRSALHVIPGKERYAFSSDKFFVLQNVPNKSEINKAKEHFENRAWPESKLVINVNGWLGADRGMAAALAIANHFNKSDIALIVAGKIDCPEAEQLVKCDSVMYLGKVSNAEALASYICSDYVLTYYDPKHEINTMAQSNKWGDALALGSRVIVNTEVKTAGFLREQNGCIFCPYHDHIDLIAQLERVIATPKQNSVHDSNSFLVFEDQLDQLFAEFGQLPLPNSR